MEAVMEIVRASKTRSRAAPDTAELDASVARHPAGKALRDCPTCDGRGKVTQQVLDEMVQAVVGRAAPLPRAR